MVVAGFYIHPAVKNGFFGFYFRCVTLADRKSLPLTRADFPVSGENVCEADKRGLEVDFAKQKTEGENNISPPASLRSAAPSSEGAFARGAIHGDCCTKFFLVDKSR